MKEWGLAMNDDQPDYVVVLEYFPSSISHKNITGHPDKHSAKNRAD